jgi:putative transposase
MHARGRGEGALRRYRVSLSETSYFLTLCTAERVDVLTREESAKAIRAEIAALETAGHWIQRAGVLMPDHLHLLVRLTGDLPVERCVARLKAKTCPALVVHNLAWQPNFYDHRLRPSTVSKRCYVTCFSTRIVAV